jgi:hypothetical protein
MTLTRLVMIGVAAMLWAGPAGAQNKLDPAENAPPAREAHAPSASAQACLSVDAIDRGTSYAGFRAANGHTQEITSRSFETVVTYTCPIAQKVVVVAKLGRTLFGACRGADRYELTFAPSARRLKIDGTEKNCVVSVLSKSGV